MDSPPHVRPSPPPSETSSWSRISETSAGPDKARVFIRLSNGLRFLVPIAQTASVNDLHEAALRRAERFGFASDTASSYLQTTRSPEIALFGEDPVTEVLDLTQDSTFSLHSLQDESLQALAVDGLASSSQRNHVLGTRISANTNGESIPPEASAVYIRWVTLENALSNSQLSSIQVDPRRIPNVTTLHELHKIATSKVARGGPGQSEAEFKKASLYLKDCRLSAENSAMTLRDLDLVGSKTAPLDIFIDTELSENVTSLTDMTQDTDLQTLWGFPTTKRGICVLTTTLDVLISQCFRDERALDNFSSSLFEITHFPPLLIALRRLKGHGIEDKACTSDLRMIAYAFNILCLQIAPLWVSPSPETALESSRQLIVWIQSLQPSVQLNYEIGEPIFGQVHIGEKTDNHPQEWDSLPCHYTVDDLIVSESSSVTPRKVTVVLDVQDQTSATFLGRAIGPTDLAYDFYLRLSTNWQSLVHHKQISTIQPTDYDNLLVLTSLSDIFRVVGPLQLGACLATQLPVITLSSGGYLSLYKQEYYECSEKRFYTWNAVEKKEIMPHTDPGQFLMQKLESIIADRKKKGTWAPDAWDDWSKKEDFGRPEEAIVVCMDTSYSMSTAMPDTWISKLTAASDCPSRLTEVKEFFKNLALRISALRISTHLGLVTFSKSTDVMVHQQLTPVHLNFEEKVRFLVPQTQTAIYDGIEEARKMLCELKSNYPTVKCRIIVLTDGCDNNSTCKPQDVVEDLLEHDITLDSIVIGTDTTSDLFKISRATGGYAFAPKTQQTFFQIFLLETVVDIRTRPDIVKDPRKDPQTWETYLPKTADMKNPYEFPPCRPHPNQSDYFIALADAERFLGRQARQPSSSSPSVWSFSTRSNSTTISGTTIGSASGVARIILSEIKEMIKNSHAYMDVYVSESNTGFWKIAMQGPPASPYADGVFLLYLEIGQEFPLKPPAARFITPMLHPNITKHGRICHPIFDREWTGNTRIYQILQHIWAILMSLESRDAVDPLSTLKFWTDPVQGRKDVEEYVQKFASRSRADIRNEIISGDDTSSTSSVISGSWELASNAPSSAATSTDTVTARSVIPGVPPSLRSAASNRPARIPSSNISTYLAAQRSPPPMMTMPGQPTRQTATATSGQTASQNAGSERRLSRRSSFFQKLRKQT